MNRVGTSIIIIFLILFPFGNNIQARDFVLFQNEKVISLVLVNKTESPVDAAAKMLSEDFLSVTGCKPEIIYDLAGYKRKSPCVLAGTIGENKAFDRFLSKNKIETSSLLGHEESFRLQVIDAGNRLFLLVLGSDPHGTAYGLLELSRHIGVSPWIWWADATPEHQEFLSFPAEKIIQDYPSVRYRGIFINDEDWGLMPWATKTLSPGSQKGAIGPEAYEQICRLLLRLRANMMWPAMHECTVPFYKVPGNSEVAKRYGIYIGTSHCEPLLCNIAGEWNAARYGDYNYLTNNDSILSYWQRRVIKTKDTPALYTLGMRGVHDGKMQGANTTEEQKVLLQKVLNDQRSLLGETIKKPLKEIPQVFIPYKEVLDVYDSGLNVPEDVTLIWCDDNYGYINRLNGPRELMRSGGSGVYYHISYWGRPHDYLWLATTNTSQIWFEMSRAWESNARKVWVVNVGDIKPAEYLTEYFLDLAWSVGKDKDNVCAENEAPYAGHLKKFLSREFGSEFSEDLSQIMQQFYYLATLRKPEHMAWTRVEETGFPSGRTPVINTGFSRKEIDERLDAYAKLENRVRTIEERLPGSERASFYQMIAYPVYGASLLNQKLLYAQLSRQLEKSDSVMASTYAAASIFAYEEIGRLTKYYNEKMCYGKWNLMLSDHPRDLYVFGEPVLPEQFKNVKSRPILTPRVILRSAGEEQTSALFTETDSCVAFPASASASGNVIYGLGHSKSAVWLKKGESLEYTFETTSKGAAELRICSLPNHAADGGDLRYKVCLNDEASVELNTRTFGRSEEWKQGVLRNQSIRKISFNIPVSGKQKLVITALDDDVVLDQITLDFRKERQGYLVPGTTMR